MGKYKPYMLLGPGDAIKEDLEFYGWEQKDLAEIMGLSEKHISQLLNNKVPITFDMACQLSQVFKQSPQFWINLDTNYRLLLEKDAQSEETAAKALIYRYMPIRDMKKKGWLSEKGNIINPVKDFWGIDKLQFDFLEKRAEVYFRKSDAQNQFNPYYALTWLHKAKKEMAGVKEIIKFKEEDLYQLSDKITQMTIDEDGIKKFIDSLYKIGVLFLYLPHLEKTYTDGAVFWHKGNPVIVYTARYDRKDNFWFTVAHEIGHILLHDKLEKHEFIDSLEHLDMDDALEKEADDFARKHLKLNDILRYFKGIERVSKKRVLSCAEFLGIHPGIVVGCLQYENKIRYYSLNEFKEPVRKILEECK